MLMKEFVATGTLVPLRMGPSHRVEMGSQILLGEKFVILDKAGSWTKIECCFDKYAGWVDNDHFKPFEISEQSKGKVLPVGIVVKDKNGNKVNIYQGSELFDISDDGMEFRVGPNKYRSETNLFKLNRKGSICDTAFEFINAPYLWGGRTAHGIDCSGLSQLCMKIHGMDIPRDSFKQANVGTTINMLNDAIPGDLLFFDNSAGKITHVGILFDSKHIIHASGSVRIDMIDHQGIFKKDQDSYTHKLRLIKRIN